MRSSNSQIPGQGPRGAESADLPAVMRGVLAVALERCYPGSDAALEICAAWEVLDFVWPPSVVAEPQVPDVFGADVVVAMGKRMLRAAILEVQPVSAAFPLAEALRHLATAARILAGEATCDGPTWD